MSGMTIEGGKLTITDGARTVATTDGTLVCLLPTMQSFTGQTLTLPDFDKDEAYYHSSANKVQPLSSPEKYQHAESCTCLITAVPQEFSNKTVLMAAPAGADFFIGSLRLTRITAPQNTWQGRTIAVLPVQNEWIPINGAASLLLETDIGMARAMHVYIDASQNLVLEAQQSVSVPPGGFTGNGNDQVGFSANDGVNYFELGSILSVTAKGVPIYQRSSKSYGYTSPAAGSLGTTYTTYRRNGSSPCARSDTTVYTSVYSVDVRGRFGRRS